MKTGRIGLSVLFACISGAALLLGIHARDPAAAGEPKAGQTSTASPLNKINPKAIPPLERFNWHPRELVAVVGEHRGRQGAHVYSVAVSPDGKQVASGASNGVIRLWDRVTMRLQQVLGHGGAVSGVAYFSDGNTLAASGHDGAVSVWRKGKDGKFVLAATMRDSTSYLYSIAVSPNGKLIAAGGFDNTVRLWDVPEKGPPTVRPFLQEHGGAIGSVAFSPDSKTLASASYDGTIILWAVGGEKNRLLARLKGHDKEVRAVTFSHDGKTLISGGNDGTIRFWDISLRVPQQTTIVPTKYGPVLSLSLGPRGSKALASGHNDNTAHIWTLTKPVREKAVVTGHASTVNTLAFVPSTRAKATSLVTGSSDWTVRVWDLTGARPVDRTVGPIPRGHLSHVYAVAFSPDAKTLASAALDTGLRIWDMAQAHPQERYYLKKDPMIVYTLAYSPDGKTLAYGGNDVHVRLWDPEKKWQIRRFSDHPGAVGSLAFSSDGRRLATMSAKQIRVYDVNKGTELLAIMGHTGNVNAIAFSPDGKRLLSGAGSYLYKNGVVVLKDGRAVYEDCTARLWNTADGKELYVFKGQDLPVNTLAFDADGKGIFYGSSDLVLRHYLLKGDKPGPLTTYKGKAGYLHCVRISPDGKLMVTVGLDNLVILWDLAKGTRLREWSFAEAVYQAVFAPDGRHLAIPAATGVIYLLRLERTVDLQLPLENSKK